MKIYLVGGAVRDALLNIPVKEQDWVVVGATPQEMLDLGYRPVGKDFPVFLHPDSNEEYALARTERKSGPGYTGFECYAGADVSLSDDLLRRDLTINAMARDEDGALVDPHGGKRDLEARILRHVSPAFEEDPLRILRVARFAARYHDLGFTVAPETAALLRRMATRGDLEELVPERVWQEFRRALAEPHPERFFALLEECGGLTWLVPPFEDGAIYKRAMAMLTRAAARSQEVAIRFAASLVTLNADEIGALCERFRVPRREQDLALRCQRHRETVGDLRRLSAQEILDLLEQLDAFRRRERFDEFVRACTALADDVEGDGPAEPGVGILQRSLERAAEVTSADAPGPASGEELGRAIRALRAESIRKLLDEGTR